MSGFGKKGESQNGQSIAELESQYAESVNKIRKILNGRTDKKASGIGLDLCSRICGRLGHKISAESRIGEGTIIRIDLSEARVEIE